MSASPAEKFAGEAATSVRHIHLADEAATRRFGEDLAMIVRAGDAVALRGGLGAGKSTLARALIRALAGDPDLEVPSPTYTLVQSYDTAPPVSHLDLYRLGDESEADELGIEEMLETGLVIVEWPERAPTLLGRATLDIAIELDGAGRRATLSGTAEAVERAARSLQLRDFLEGIAPSPSDRRRLFGDASSRRYETASMGGQPVIVMDSPKRPNGPPIRNSLPYSRIAHLAEDVLPFVAVDKLLRDHGFAAPAILGRDLDAGFLVIEHLGTETMLSDDGLPVFERYEATALALAHLHAQAIDPVVALAPGRSHTVPPFDHTAMGIEVEMLLDWYLPDVFGRPASIGERQVFLAVWGDLFARLDEAERSLLLRDVHSPNVIWRGDREGLDRVGLIDFQDAMIGPSAYDLASLAQDARVDIAPDFENRLLSSYLAARHAADATFDEAAFRQAYAMMAAQRATKILGIFVRLEKRDGKPFYRRHIPRVSAYLRRSLEHPALAALRDLYSSWGILGLETTDPSAR
ncbi:tRNA (adenosine(37)-N6)-threonylcarbamoyltransferase complex ATPase subunit type 1 TsaE [Aureimonas psammosilenae]|uniref:tRNA (adenosine(37)-N6)-threonylcarbamoyltransferase complex ATPase subunit type 1 TsaE n=1 Tax=Aureimonas psammosilenae TaxID=2495496 RepID=UPI0012607F7F|nr:tRNA (adenosine(37)-N6)-threonylcarbamoyltransferase complex ATPase subunit type 1 TsaE [Aureimonas psammosilenae]